MIAALKQKETYQKYLKSLKFALYCLTHPLDGFWDLTHEKRGSYAAANTILILTIFVRLIKLKYTSFVVEEPVYWEDINIFLYIGSILLPLGLWVVGNWGLTTLFDGKGRLGQVYMATCYGMAPYPLINLPLMIISNFVTIDEAELFVTIGYIVLIYCGILIIAGIGQIHEFSAGKNLLFTIASLFAMLVLVFILMIFFSMVSKGVAYIVSFIREFLFRI